jgi:hypothetical protein
VFRSPSPQRHCPAAMEARGLGLGAPRSSLRSPAFFSMCSFRLKYQFSERRDEKQAVGKAAKQTVGKAERRGSFSSFVAAADDLAFMAVMQGGVEPPPLPIKVAGARAGPAGPAGAAGPGAADPPSAPARRPSKLQSFLTKHPALALSDISKLRFLPQSPRCVKAALAPVPSPGFLAATKRLD